MFITKYRKPALRGDIGKEVRDLTRETRKLDQLDSVVSLKELRIPPGNRLEALSGNREGQFSIRINERYRICFFWAEAGPEEVGIVDYH